jgi:hypothetical protein
VHIIEATPCNRNGTPKNDFQKGEPLFLRLKLQNIRFHDTVAALTVSIQDTLQQVILFYAYEYVLAPNETSVFLDVGSIPNQAFVGDATAYLDAFTWLHGSPYCPEVPVSFAIMRSLPDVAVFNVMATVSETQVGQSIQLTIPVMNEYCKPLSFNVTVRANSTTVRIVAVNDLTPFTETNVTCVWDTYEFPVGSYRLSAEASVVSGETDTDDNQYVDGIVRLVTRVNPVHDVAVVSLAVSRNVVGQGLCVLIGLTIQNQGDYAETLNVIIYANQTVIAAFFNVNLTSGSSTTIACTWNTSGFTYAFVMGAEASTVAGETDLLDNSLTDGTVKATCLGDINGDYVTDAKDFQLVKLAIPSMPGNPRWNSNADMNDDLVIDGKDYQIVKRHIPSHLP